MGLSDRVWNLLLAELVAMATGMLNGCRVLRRVMRVVRVRVVGRLGRMWRPRMVCVRVRIEVGVLLIGGVLTLRMATVGLS